MGTRWSITVWHALSDFEGAERDFLLEVCEEVFTPTPVDEDEEDAYWDDIWERRPAFHDAHGLPGTMNDWTSVHACEWQGETYLTSAIPVSQDLMPPFPRIFGEHHWIYRKIPLPTPWHILFGGADRDLQESRIFVRLESARRHYEEAFRGIVELIHWAYRCPEEFRERTPRFSDGWSIIRKLLTLFDPGEYMQVIRILSGGDGGHAALELRFREEIRADDGDPDAMRARRERFLADNAALNRILRSARERDLPVLAREVPIRVDYHDSLHAIVRWLTYDDRDFVRPFVKTILTEEERNRSVERALF
jgi:hypothetical protein